MMLRIATLVVMIVVLLTGAAMLWQAIRVIQLSVGLESDLGWDMGLRGVVIAIWWIGGACFMATKPSWTCLALITVIIVCARGIPPGDRLIYPANFIYEWMDIATILLVPVAIIGLIKFIVQDRRADANNRTNRSSPFEL